MANKKAASLLLFSSRVHLKRETYPDI